MMLWVNINFNFSLGKVGSSQSPIHMLITCLDHDLLISPANYYIFVLSYTQLACQLPSFCLIHELINIFINFKTVRSSLLSNIINE